MIYMKDIIYKGKTYIIEFEMLDDHQNEVSHIKMFKYNKDDVDKYKTFLYSLEFLSVDDYNMALLKDNVGNEIMSSDFLRSPRKALQCLLSSYEQHTPIEAFILEDIVID
ncbi:hypothetical protein KLEB273_gp265 [Bacillus phage vB_BauM_KLEB27-3]|nr:hypothetical protein KLEB273_gp265 [Bacillus phage vB_BauM_KLEB27-3]